MFGVIGMKQTITTLQLNKSSYLGSVEAAAHMACQSSIKCCLIGVLFSLGLLRLLSTRLAFVPRYSGCNQSVCNQPSSCGCQVILAVLVAICACAHVTAGRAAKLPVWVSGWHHADFLSALCERRIERPDGC